MTNHRTPTPRPAKVEVGDPRTWLNGDITVRILDPQLDVDRITVVAETAPGLELIRVTIPGRVAAAGLADTVIADVLCTIACNLLRSPPPPRPRLVSVTPPAD